MSDDRILLGMHRPEWSEFFRDVETKWNADYEQKSAVALASGWAFDYAEVQIPCCFGYHIYANYESRNKDQRLRESWLAGHFDTPVYATRDEVLSRMAGGPRTPSVAMREFVVSFAKLFCTGWPANTDLQYVCNLAKETHKAAESFLKDGEQE